MSNYIAVYLYVRLFEQQGGTTADPTLRYLARTFLTSHLLYHNFLIKLGTIHRRYDFLFFFLKRAVNMVSFRRHFALIVTNTDQRTPVIGDAARRLRMDRKRRSGREKSDQQAHAGVTTTNSGQRAYRSCSVMMRSSLQLIRRQPDRTFTKEIRQQSMKLS